MQLSLLSETAKLSTEPQINKTGEALTVPRTLNAESTQAYTLSLYECDKGKLHLKPVRREKKNLLFNFFRNCASDNVCVVQKQKCLIFLQKK